MRTRFSSVRAIAIALVAAAALQIDATSASAAIVAVLETPTGSEISSGIANVQGWAYATQPGDEIEPLIEVYIDGQFVMEVPCCSDRGDVKALHPEAPMQTGFSGAFNYSSLTPGLHTMQAHVFSKLGDHTILTETFTSARLGSFAYNKKFDWTTANADHCDRGNEILGGEVVATMTCTGMTFEASDGSTQQCIGDVELAWMPSAQGFRVTKGCDQLN